MRKTNNPYVPLDMSELFPHRTNPAFVAVDDLHAFIGSVLESQDKAHQNDLDALQEPLAELSEEIIELSSGGMSLRSWRRRYEAALRLCDKARLAISSLTTAQALSGEQAATIVAGIDAIQQALDKQWIALQPPELDHEDEAAAER
jgi:hypothetical protein